MLYILLKTWGVLLKRNLWHDKIAFSNSMFVITFRAQFCHKLTFSYCHLEIVICWILRPSWDIGNIFLPFQMITEDYKAGGLERLG